MGKDVEMPNQTWGRNFNKEKNNWDSVEKLKPQVVK
jgi:hypothetical protein